jgi:hypothetical protein
MTLVRTLAVTTLLIVAMAATATGVIAVWSPAHACSSGTCGETSNW